ncbi:formate dehydrogenase accessory sulfurtransferase FdhD [Noviherbaspirillum soli]|uniref:formate dehydrogenase accessory sulfurtransferase FdhD n=1 Tax=Noviherbaspirillum soli TaxID=1064518 RepID=UPI001E35B27A|nr:formate dehydrogenase accessory sulfurtransferase FdhD [Noviherbaspirillum soli]
MERHDAPYKLPGALAGRRADFFCGAVLVTSRSSCGMVQRTATLGIGMLAAVSAPTGLAARPAETAGISLAGFVRCQWLEQAGEHGAAPLRRSVRDAISRHADLIP